MNTKGPKNDSKYEWTEHSKFKMQYYGLSAQRVLRVIRSPYRIEIGIVENTIAVMQPGGNVKKRFTKSKWGKSSSAYGESEVLVDGKNWSSEIWVMYQLLDKKEKRDGNIDIKETGNKKDKKDIVDFDAAWEKLKSKLDLNKKIRVISAWRYPGVTDENDPIPAEIMREIEEII